MKSHIAHNAMFNFRIEIIPIKLEILDWRMNAHIFTWLVGGLWTFKSSEQLMKRRKECKYSSSHFCDSRLRSNLHNYIHTQEDRG